MAIRHRRGKESNFDGSKLQSGELAVCEDSSKVYVKAGSKIIELTQEQIDTVVTPEMYGAVGDGATDDSAAFTKAILSGKKVVCDGTKVYYFAKPVDVRTLYSGHLDGNGAWFLNFHIFININDEFNDWRTKYSSGRFIIENMNFGHKENGWENLPIGWETPLITTGAPTIVRNINTHYPYVLASVDEYIDFMKLDTWCCIINWDLLADYNLNLDAVSCLNKSGEYCKFSGDSTPSAYGDSWMITQCSEFSTTSTTEYKFMHITGRQSITVESCIQSSFDVGFYSKATFIGCHWEDKSDVTVSNNYLCIVLFVNCYFYNNHVLNNDKSTTYQNCFFRLAAESSSGGRTLAETTGNRSLYDMDCAMIECNFGLNALIDTRTLRNHKNAPKKTYNDLVCGGYRAKLSDMALSVELNPSYSHGDFFPSLGEYSYDIYLKSTSLPNVAVDYAGLNATVEEVESAVRLNIPYVNGGCSLTIVRTDPNGNMEKTEYYGDPNENDSPSEYVLFEFWDCGAYVRFNVGGATHWLPQPWIAISEKPTFTVNPVLYEANGVLVTTDGSTANVGWNGSVQVGNNVRYDVQDLSDERQVQARKNIGAASELYETYVTPQMFGAHADGITDDTVAIQAAIDSGEAVMFPKGTYLTTAPIIINSKYNYGLYSVGSKIVYTGADYAIKLSKCSETKFAFGMIVAENGGCLLLEVDGGSYFENVNLHFADFSAKTNCIYANVIDGAFMNVEINGGILRNAVYGIHFESAASDAIAKCTIQNVRFATTNGFFADAPSGSISGILMVGCTNPDDITSLIKTVGDVRQCNFIGSKYLFHRHFDFSNSTQQFHIIAPIVDNNYVNKAFEAVVMGGVMLLQSQVENYRYFNTEEVDLRDKDAQEPFVWYVTQITVGSAVKRIYLSNKYGRTYGVNEFLLRYDNDTGGELAIYNGDGNLIFNNVENIGWAYLQFKWYEDFGWTVSRLDNVACTTVDGVV